MKTSVIRRTTTAAILFCCLAATIMAMPSLPAKPYSVSSRIVGGEPADEHDFPWLVFIEGHGLVTKIIMHGSLITNRCVLTANGRILQSANYYDLYMGNSNLADVSKLVTYYTVQEFFRYPYGIEGFSPTIIVLPEDVPISETLYPIRIPKSGEDHDYVDETVTLAGWGSSGSQEPFPAVARKVNTTVIQRSECVSIFPFYSYSITDNNICTMGGGGGASYGDTGTPVNYFNNTSGQWIALGFHIYSDTYYGQEFPGVHYLLKDPEVLQWIEDICGPTGQVGFTNNLKPSFY